MDFPVGFDIEFEFVVADQLAVQVERRLFLDLQGSLEILLLFDQNFIAAFYGLQGVAAGFLILLLEPILQFESLL